MYRAIYFLTSLTQLQALGNFGLDRRGASNLVEIIQCIPRLSRVWIRDEESDPVSVHAAQLVAHLQIDTEQAEEFAQAESVDVATPVAGDSPGSRERFFDVAGELQRLRSLIEQFVVPPPAINTPPRSTQRLDGLERNVGQLSARIGQLSPLQRIVSDPAQMEHLLEFLSIPLESLVQLTPLRADLRCDPICKAHYRAINQLMYKAYTDAFLRTLGHADVQLPAAVRVLTVAADVASVPVLSAAARGLGLIVENVLQNISKDQAELRLSRFTTSVQFQSVSTRVADLLAAHDTAQRAGNIPEESLRGFALAQQKVTELLRQVRLLPMDLSAQEGRAFAQVAVIMDALLNADEDEVPCSTSPHFVEEMCIWMVCKAGVASESLSKLIQQRNTLDNFAHPGEVDRPATARPADEVQARLSSALTFEQMYKICTSFMMAKNRLKVGVDTKYLVSLYVPGFPFKHYKRTNLEELLKANNEQRNDSKYYTIEEDLPPITLRMRDKKELSLQVLKNRELLAELHYRYIKQ